VREIGDQETAAAVMRAALQAQVRVTPRPAVVRLAASQVEAEWLPQVDGIAFELLPPEATEWALDSCNGMWTIRWIRVESNEISVALGIGNRCETLVVERGFRRTSNWSERSFGVGSTDKAKRPCDCTR
jgi:hypothetical protein